jgi:hypothetical protein
MWKIPNTMWGTMYWQRTYQNSAGNLLQSQNVFDDDVNDNFISNRISSQFERVKIQKPGLDGKCGKSVIQCGGLCIRKGLIKIWLEICYRAKMYFMFYI